MFCGSCGREIDDSSKFCTYCGAPCAERPSSDAASLAATLPPTAPPESVGSDFLVPNLIMMIPCCCAWPGAIVALCFSFSARAAKRDGRTETAISRAAAAKTLFWINLILALGLFACAPFGISLIDHVEQSLERSWDAPDEDLNRLIQEVLDKVEQEAPSSDSEGNSDDFKFDDNDVEPDGTSVDLAIRAFPTV